MDLITINLYPEILVSYPDVFHIPLSFPFASDGGGVVVSPTINPSFEYVRFGLTGFPLNSVQSSNHFARLHRIPENDGL
jgi:hypothetical protein